MGAAPTTAVNRSSCEWRGQGRTVVRQRSRSPTGSRLRHPSDLTPGQSVAARRSFPAYIWPDQADTSGRANCAPDLTAQLGSPVVEAIDAARFAGMTTRRRFRNRAGARARSSGNICRGQAGGAIRAAIAEAAGRATRASPFALAAAGSRAEERRGAVLRLSLWPEPDQVDEVLAVASFHGQWIEWRAAG